MKKINILIAAVGITVAIAGFSVYRSVSAAYPYSMTYSPSTGNTILSDHVTVSNSEHINNNIPESIDDYSANATEMQSTKDPYSGDSIQLATTLDDELQGLRYILQQITGETYWYIDPPTFMENSANYDHGAYTFDLFGLLTASSITGTSTADFGSSTASLEIPNDAAITVDKIGEIGLDTTITGWHQGSVTWFGTEANYVVSIPTDTMTTTDGHVVAYSADRDQFEMTASSSIGTISAFSVHRNGTDQTSIGTGGATKVTWTTEDFDTNDDFGTSTFTPTVSGKYLLTATAHWVAINDGVLYYVYIYKNGAVEKELRINAGGSGSNGSSLNAIVEANGSGDYFDMYVRQNESGPGTSDLDGDANKTYFQGFKIAE